MMNSFGLHSKRPILKILLPNLVQSPMLALLLLCVLGLIFNRLLLVPNDREL